MLSSSNYRTEPCDVGNKSLPSSPCTRVVSENQSKLSRGSPTSYFSSDSKTVLKMTSFSESRAARVSGLQQQLSRVQEELRKEKEAKLKAHAELMEAKKSAISGQNGGDYKSKVDILEKEVDRAKESEQKMLESLISQTKVLEQTKIALEEAKLEINSLQESSRRIGRSNNAATWSSRNLEKHFFTNGLFLRSDNEVAMLQNELKFAMETESKSKKSMDELAISLKEVMTEANQAKQDLSLAHYELEKVRAELECSRKLLKSTEDKFQVASKESVRLKLELEKSISSRNTKDKEFVNCMKMSEAEIEKFKVENDKLLDSLKIAREENFKLSELAKQAANETSINKEILEISRKENAQLRDLLSNTENKFQSIKQEFECLKVSEAAATDSVKELKILLAATANTDTRKESSPVMDSSSIKTTKTMEDFSSEDWTGDKPRNINGRRHSIGEPGFFNGFASDMESSPKEKDKISATLSNVTELKVSSVVKYEANNLFSDDFDHLYAHQFECIDQTLQKQKKKKPVLRRFGDMFRRKSSQRQNSPSI